jgi:hypothetical protein
MTRKINRRIFLALSGAAAVAAAAKWKNPAPQSGPGVPGGISFYAETRGRPAGRPRTAAIIYLPADEGYGPVTHNQTS